MLATMYHLAQANVAHALAPRHRPRPRPRMAASFARLGDRFALAASS